MTAPNLALAEVLALLEKATPGPWRWSENGNILGSVPFVGAERPDYNELEEICAVYTDDEDTGAPNAPAIVAAVNLLRAHGPALRSALQDNAAIAHFRNHEVKTELDLGQIAGMLKELARISASENNRGVTFRATAIGAQAAACESALRGEGDGRDAARLDWLEKNLNAERMLRVTNNAESRQWSDCDTGECYPTLRTAIDTAIERATGGRDE